MQAPPRQKTAEEERARAAARQAEKEAWERNRGAGSAVFKLAEAGRIKPKAPRKHYNNHYHHGFDKAGNGAASHERVKEEPETPANGTEESSAASSSMSVDSWTAQDVLPSLEEVEKKLYEPVYVPSADVLLSRGICDYTLLPKTLGRGKFSTVFVASKFGELHAIKHTALFPHHQLIATRLLREPTLLAELPPHPNLVSVKETIRTPDHFYLVEEYLSDYVTLEALMPMLNPKPPHILPIPAAEKVLTQLLSAVRAIHVPLQICHRDIKPENILVHPQTLQLKLLDFGLATHFSKSEPKLSTCCGSPAFHSPEIVKSLASPPGTVVYMGPEVDAWTVGVTMLRCMTGARFPLGATHSSLRGMSIRAQRALAGIADVSLRERIARLLDMDAKKRMASFEEMVTEQERTFGEPDRSAKRFKSTTFISSAPTHSIRLPLIDSTNVYDSSSHMVQSGMATPTSASRRTTPSNSRAPSPSRLPPAATSVVQGTTLTALNPTSQSPERVISFVKYCLRCAGILYHTWPDTSGISKTNKHGYLGSHASQPTTYVSAAFAEAVGSPLDASTAPSTPLLPPSFTGLEDRHDGYAHVQVFQCVIELPEEKEDPTTSAMGQLGQLSLVQSIMAAFSRKPAPSNQTNPAGASNSTANRAQAASTTPQRPRMEGKRSLSTPATPRAKTTATVNAVGAGKASSGNGSTRCLAFHLIVKFPSQQQQMQSMVRQAVSRASSYFGAVAPPLQEEQTQQQQTHRSLRSRASSASGVLSSDLADSFGIEKRMPPHHPRGGSPTMDLLRPSISRNQDGFAPATKSVEVTAESPSVPSARPANRSPSASRPHSQTRKRSSRGYQKRPKVYFHVTDDRAVHAIREALSVGGTVDAFELEEMSRTGYSNHAAQASGLVGHDAESSGTVNGNHAQSGTRRTARRKTRDLSTLQINTPWPSAQSETISTPVSPVVNVNKEDRGFSRDSASENEDTPRGRSMASSRERFNGNSRSGSDNVSRQHEVEKGANEGYVSARAPSQLSSLAVKEESPANDGFSQTIDSLAHTLNQIVSGVSSSSTSPSARSSPSSPESEQEPVKEQQIEKILNGLDSMKMTYEGRQAGLLTQARSQLLEISRILHRAARKDANVLQDTISPISFNLFSALSPALGLIPTETLGLPASSTVLNEAHGGATTLRGLAMSSFEIFAQHASPREIFLAAQERIEFLGSNQQLEVSGCRTERDKLHKNSRQSSDDPVDFKQLESPWSSALEMAGLLHILCISVHRLKTQKPVSFVEPLMDLIPRAAQSVLRAAIELPRTSDEDNATVLKPQGIEAWRRDLSACEIGLGIVALCRNVGQWAAGLGDKVEEDVKQTLLTLLYSSVIVVLPHIPKLQGGDSLAHAYFIQLMPQYNVVRPSTESATVAAHDPLPTVEALREEFWTQIRALIDLWNVNVEEQALQRQSRHQAESATAMQTVGAFKLLVNLLAQDAKNLHRPPQWPAKDALSKLQRSIGLVVASLGNGPPAALSKDGSRSLGSLMLLPDVALTWALWCVENARTGDTDERQGDAEMLLTSEEAILFVHTLSTYAALSPRPDARQISLYVVRRTLSSLVEASMAHELMYEIMTQSPYPQLRAAFVGLARSMIVAELDDEQQSSRRLAVPGFITLLEPKVFALPQDCVRILDEADDEVVKTSMRACMDDNAAWLSECLSFVYLIVCKDEKKGKHIISSQTLENINTNLLTPLDKLIVRLRQLVGNPSAQNTKAVESNIEFDMILSMLDVGLQRAKEAVASASAPSDT